MHLGARSATSPPIVAARDIEIDVPGFGPLSVDIAYGGNFYAIIEPQGAYRGLDDLGAARIVELSRTIRALLREQITPGPSARSDGSAASPTCSGPTRRKARARTAATPSSTASGRSTAAPAAPAPRPAWPISPPRAAEGRRHASSTNAISAAASSAGSRRRPRSAAFRPSSPRSTARPSRPASTRSGSTATIRSTPASRHMSVVAQPARPARRPAARAHPLRRGARPSGRAPGRARRRAGRQQDPAARGDGAAGAGGAAPLRAQSRLVRPPAERRRGARGLCAAAEARAGHWPRSPRPAPATERAGGRGRRARQRSTARPDDGAAVGALNRAFHLALVRPARPAGHLRHRRAAARPCPTAMSASISSRSAATRAPMHEHRALLDAWLARDAQGGRGAARAIISARRWTISSGSSRRIETKRGSRDGAIDPGGR